MTRESRKHALKLSRNVGDRILVGCLALPVSVISGLGVWTVATRSHAANGVAETLWKLVIDEAVVAIFLLSALSVIWAVAAPRWLESLFRRIAMKAIFGTLVFMGMVLWLYGFAQNR